MSEERFPVEAWKKIFSRVPEYPTDLPDDVVRYLANLAIHVRSLAENLGEAVKSGDPLVLYMGPSLISSSLKQINRYIEGEIERGPYPFDHAHDATGKCVAPPSHGGVE